MKKISLIIYILLIHFKIYSQGITGKITDINNNPINGVTISTNSGIRSSSDKIGNYTLDIPKGNYIISFEHVSFSKKEKKIVLNKKEKKRIDVKLLEKSNILEGVEIISKKEKKDLLPIISLEVINEDFFKEKVNTDVSAIINQVSGVALSDDQVHIRGASGWNPMAGSRVLFMVNDFPLLTGNMGQIPWDFIPMENIENIEVIKGASSAIYGSSALNGVINIKTKSPNTSIINKNPSWGYTQINILHGYYDNPNREDLVWWENQNRFSNLDLLHSGIFNYSTSKYDPNITSYLISANYLNDEGYRMGQNITRKRISGNIHHRINRLRLGINGTYMEKEDGMFLLWESFENGYIPKDSNFYRKKSSIYEISPYISLKTKKGEHSLKTQILDISLDYNPNEEEENNDMSSKIYYIDYQYKNQKIFGLLKGDIVIGANSKITSANAKVFSGTNYAMNNSLYTLLEPKIKNITLSFGGRYERINVRSTKEFENKEIDTTVIFPLFYAGIKYKINSNHNIRTYWGQGVRFPSIAERFVSTEAIQGSYIFPNTSLNPESGWNFEFAYTINQNSIKSQKLINWNMDFAYFIMRYKNMMEFGFEQFGTEFDYEHAYGLGFKTINVGETQISGFESKLDIKLMPFTNWKADILLGYTYMNPIALNPTESYEEINIADTIRFITFNNSSSDNSILKYRYQHLLKIDAKIKYNKYSMGVNINYNDYMKNIDTIFTTELINEGVSIYPAIIPGINESRELNKKGDLLIDLTFGIKINNIAQLNFIINNVTNAEIYARPTDIRPPRTYSIKLNLSI